MTRTPLSRHQSASELVQSMAKAARIDSTHIRTVLAHVEDQRGVLEVLLDDSVLKGPINVDIREARTVEAFVPVLLGTSFHGLTFSLRPGPDRPFPSTSRLTYVPPGELTERPERDIPAVFTDATLAMFDSARRSTSVFDGTTNDEFLVQLPSGATLAGEGQGEVEGDGESPRTYPCFRDVVARIAGLTTSMGRPLWFAHAPVAAPTLRNQPRGVTGSCLRFGVAFPQFDHSALLRFGTQLVELCCAEGYGLWQRSTITGDNRHDYWQSIVPLQAVDDDSTTTDYVPPAQGLAITCVGPARSGSTEAILQVLEQAGAPLAALAETTLDDIAIIHLFTYTPLDKPSVDALPSDLRADVLLSQALGLPPASTRLNATLRDYRAVVSARQERRPDPQVAALWLAWAAPASTDALRLTVRTLRTALDVTWARYRQDSAAEAHGEHLNIQYLVCREVSADWLRGRMQVAVDLDALGVKGRLAGLGQFCSDLERQWRASLSFALGTPHVDLEAVWRESWIGRWASLQAAPRDDLG